MAVKQGWFDSVQDLEEFMQEFNAIINGKDAGAPAVNELIFVKVTSDNNTPSSYSTVEHDKYIAIDGGAGERLRELILNIKITSPKPRSSSHGDGIWLYINYAMNGIHANTDIYVHPDGDITLKTSNKLIFELEIRTSPTVFKQLEEVIVYSKHSNTIKFAVERNEPEHTTDFDLAYVKDGKSRS